MKHEIKKEFFDNSLLEISDETEIEYLPNDEFSTAEAEAMDIIQNLRSCTEIKTDFSTKKEIKQEFEVKQEIKEYFPNDEFSKTEQDAIDIIQDIEVEFEPGKEELKSC